MSHQKLGMVVLNYNDADETLRLLNDICDYPSIDRIVIVDNFSSDDSVEILRAFSNPKVDLLCAKENKGYASGNNIGIKYLLEKYDIDILGIANPDVVFDEPFVGKIKKIFGSNNEYAALSGLQYGIDGKIYKHAFWKRHTAKSVYLDVLKKYPLIGRLFLKIGGTETYVTNELTKHDGLFTVGTLGGCLFFIRSEDFVKAGLFDENTFLYFEEDILSIRLTDLGKKEGVDSSLSFVHKGSVSVSKSVPQIRKEKLMLQSERYFFKTYISQSKLKLFLFDLIVNIYLLLLPATLKVYSWIQSRTGK